jgi:hypothetical protein
MGLPRIYDVNRGCGRGALAKRLLPPKAIALCYMDSVGWPTTFSVRTEKISIPSLVFVELLPRSVVQGTHGRCPCVA